MELVIGAGESLIQWLLLPRLPGLAQGHPRLAVTFQNLKTEEIQRQVLDEAIDFGVVSHFEPHRALGVAPLGKLEFCLFAPTDLLPANPKIKINSKILGELPLAMLDGGASIRQSIQREA
jgi:DNA-binding transcriptional LysR family regulator